MTPDDGYDENAASGSDPDDYDVDEMLDEWYELYENDPDSVPTPAELWPDCPPHILHELADRIDQIRSGPVDSFLKRLRRDERDGTIDLSMLKEDYVPVRDTGYWLVKRLGSGESGFGVVWKAENEEGTFRALKFCKKPLNEKARTTFQNEFRLIRYLNHPSIVRLERHFLDHSIHPFLEYEYVDGPDLSVPLSQRFQTVGALGPDHAAAVILKLVDIIAFVHSQPKPIVHRDLKPENILVSNYPWCPFSIARIWEFW